MMYESHVKLKFQEVLGKGPCLEGCTGTEPHHWSLSPLGDTSRVDEAQQTLWPARLKAFTSWPFTENVSRSRTTL